eukprot:TRINITY_DN12766_c0_g1_i1.p1 TRINITY_DN12766_c0_g1~~TRINITY_DN12766_c0_g1_i1.p1  ORF type:complete len:154 (-),score=50.68 TRINITY_DN12766_c0_g1_i1:162-584(-)
MDLFCCAAKRSSQNGNALTGRSLGTNAFSEASTDAWGKDKDKLQNAKRHDGSNGTSSTAQEKEKEKKKDQDQDSSEEEKEEDYTTPMQRFRGSIVQAVKSTPIVGALAGYEENKDVPAAAAAPAAGSEDKNVSRDDTERL